MPDFLSYHPELTPLPVIATYSADGDFRPLYFQLDGNCVKIENIKWSNVNADSSTFFCCEVMDGEYVREFVLVYIYSQHRWFLDTKKRKAFVTRKKRTSRSQSLLTVSQ